MKPSLFFYLLLVGFVLHAKEYMAKVEPIYIYTIAANVSGEILFVDEDALGKKIVQKPVILIDDTTDKADLEATRKKLDTLKRMIVLDTEVIENLQESLKRKQQNYDSIKALTVKSKTEKDAVYFDLVATKNQLLAMQKEVQNFLLQKADLEARIVRLKKSIQDKRIFPKEMVLYEILVRKGEVATLGKPLVKVADTSKGLLTIYVGADELQNIRAKKVFLNGKETSYKASRSVSIADSVNISKYKVQIIIDAPKIFSKLVKVEFK